MRALILFASASSLLAQTALYVSTLSTDGAITTSVYSTADRSRLGFTGARSGAITVGPDGRYFLTDSNTASIGLYNAGTAVLAAAANTGGNPVATAVAPNGQRVYVAAYGGGIVSVHDARTLLLIGSLGTGYSPSAIAVHPDSSRVYVAHASSAEVAVMTAVPPLRVTKRITTGGGPVALAQLNPQTLLVLNSGAENVERISVETDEVSGSFPVGPEPAAMALAGGRLYVSNSGDSQLRIFDPVAGRQTGMIQLPGCGSTGRCAVMSLAVDGNTLYAANSNGSQVFAVDMTSNAVTASIATPSGPRWIAVGPRP